MKIGRKYQLVSDSLNITLQERRHNKKQGKHYWENIAYFATAHNALDYLLEQNIRESGFENLETVCKKIDEVYKLVNDLRYRMGEL